MKNFSGKELQKLHDGSMNILKNIGVRFSHPGALEVFKRNNFKISSDVVHFSEKDILRAIETVPDKFVIEAANSSKSVTIGNENPVMSPGYGAPFIISPNGDKREGTYEDYNNFCKLVQTSKAIDFNGSLMVQPSDLSSQTAHLDLLYSNFVLSDKPFMSPAHSLNAAQDSLAMLTLLWEDEGALKEKYLTMSSGISPLSPLQYAPEMIDGLVTFAEKKQPINFGACLMAGSTAPVTLAGTIVLQNAELLSAIVLTQLITPGLPIIYGGTSSLVDMKTGSFAIGAPELSIIQTATAELGRYYKLPSRGSGGLTDAHFPDMQAGIESATGLINTVLQGNHFIWHACGILSSYMAMSFEKFVIDEEICNMARRIKQGTLITKETIGLSAIQDVGIGGEFLTHAHTFEYFNQEAFLPDLLSRQDYQHWDGAGRKMLHQTARDEVEKRLNSYEKPDVNPSTSKALKQYMTKKKTI